MATANEHTLPQLPYAYNALEPTISAQIMEIHHSKHHQTYVNNLNAAEKAYASAVQNKDIRTQIATQQAIKFNGGGHINHSLFWKNLAPTSEGGGSLQEGNLKQAIDRDFGSFDKFRTKFNQTALGIQGSGWAWLGFKDGRLDVVAAKDQDPLTTHYPILGLDMWEHAFYLQHQNNKAAYVDTVWKVFNWKEAEKRFQDAQQKASL
ncbi:manganese and iron superoxide dismutase [Jaminaea rosea]|uniref:Superoxide dismutase n=1 Tax=Jaminaea rosea TaxID=1569628 RepID=A0A316UR02_9BASI|nr:manganese and iron superoxide dismutase [Jaminaea rosea]PWN27218.1 manganese and iron superoxide dismutase [Jaminaea rosea]